MRHLFKKDTPEGRVQTEIKNTEFRKSTMISAVRNEKSELEQQRTQTFQEIGVVAYCNHCDGVKVNQFTEFFDKIDGLEVEIAEKENKIQQIEERYQEEVTLLEATLQNILNPPPPREEHKEKSGNQLFCERCGHLAKENDSFCRACGNPMPKG